MSNQFGQTLVSTGLNTTTLKMPFDGSYFFRGTIDLPTLTNGGGVSAVVVTIAVNSSTKYTGTAGATGFGYQSAPLTAGDTVTVALTSANAVDALNNAQRMTLAWGLGE